MAEQLALRLPTPTTTETAATYLGSVLERLAKRPRQGLERQLSREEVAWRLKEILGSERQRNPDYGEWPTDRNMWAGDVLRAQDLLDYVITATTVIYPLEAHPPINDSLMYKKIGFEDPDVESLLEHAVIKPTGQSLDVHDRSYYLHEPYGDYWFRQVVENL